MSDEFLSTGFPDVDNAQDIDAYFDCLTLLDSLAYYKAYKIKSYELMQLTPGMKVLDAGCGLGDDAFRIAEIIKPCGKVIGIDASVAMIEKARTNELAKQLPVQFQSGDVKALPFPDNSFARCRIDRVLQHIPQPQKAVSELVRVLEPDGLLLAYDNDWGTFSIASSNAEVTRTIENFWCDSFTNSLIGRNLCDYFISCGLSDIKIYPGTCIINDFETADKVYNLRNTAQKVIAGGIIFDTQGSNWIAELIHRTQIGSFMATHTAYTVIGKKY